MSFPITSLIAEHRELGLVVAVLLGFGFGFTLERAGFGQAKKLAAQFYFTDMTVFKVMFTSIVTAMLGVLLFSGVGLAELKVVGQSVASVTYLWPMLAGGLLLGAGFIISGYCPGTGLVAAASGNLDGVVAIAGVLIGSLGFAEIAELWPAFSTFYLSGDKGQWFLYELLGVPAPVLGLAITAMALAMFIGAEKVEQIMARKGEDTAEISPTARGARRLAFGALAGTAVLTLGTLALPSHPQAAEKKTVTTIEQRTFAQRMLDEPWTLRILDLREDKACKAKRVPGSECTPRKTVDKLGLAYTAGAKDLVLVDEGKRREVPQAVLKYPGKVMMLEGGFPGWKRYALTPPKAPGPDASAAKREAYQFRAALHAAMLGAKPPAPPPAGTKRYVPKPKKKKGGGCG